MELNLNLTSLVVNHANQMCTITCLESLEMGDVVAAYVEVDALSLFSVGPDKSKEKDKIKKKKSESDERGRGPFLSSLGVAGQGDKGTRGE